MSKQSKQIMEQYKRYRVKVDYKRTDDLKPQAIPNGSIVTGQCMYRHAADETYPNQMIFMPDEGHLWIPECDLIVLEKL